MGAARATRILIVDDSAVMRSLLRSVVSTDARLEVVGTASNGASALRVLDGLRPDLVLLDVEMPVMDGLSTLRQMKLCARRVPVIMCSSLTQRGAQVTLEALACGAADYVAKPSGQSSRESAVKALAHDLIPRILALTAQSIPTLMPAPGPFPASGQAAQSSLPAAGSASPAVVVVGVSTGGPAALEVVLPALPATFPLPVLVVQHMPELFTGMLAQRLHSRCALPVAEAEPGQPVKPGTIAIARGNWHMELAPGRAQPTLRLQQEPPENHCRPAADVLFRSAVSLYGARIMAVMLTGMGYDGLAGCRLIRHHGGIVLAQDEATSTVWGMPGAVVNAGLANKVLPLESIAAEIVRSLRPPAAPARREAVELRETVV